MNIWQLQNKRPSQSLSEGLPFAGSFICFATGPGCAAWRRGSVRARCDVHPRYRYRLVIKLQKCLDCNRLVYLWINIFPVLLYFYTDTSGFGDISYRITTEPLINIRIILLQVKRIVRQRCLLTDLVGIIEFQSIRQQRNFINETIHNIIRLKKNKGNYWLLVSLGVICWYWPLVSLFHHGG